MSELAYSVPEAVVEDIRAFRKEVERFLSGEIPATAFKGISAPMGVYEQRRNGTYMVRIRGAAGLFLPHQVRFIADLATKYGSGFVHVTTRQDFQIHDVKIEDTPTIIESLLDAGLSSRGGGGNTVRNISACPLAGVCRDEAFDVTPHALALTEHLMSDRASFNLPRKFKVAFSGCGKDCALASVADLGFFAHEEGGQRGFSVYAGGGMGKQAALAVLLEDFVPESEIVNVAEAVKRLFDRHGDRANRHRARLRFVVARVGTEEFRRLYREELDSVRREGLAAPSISPLDQPCAPLDPDLGRGALGTKLALWGRANVLKQKQEGLFAVRIPLRLGNISSVGLATVADVSESVGGGLVRTTQDQELLIPHVRGTDVRRVHTALHSAGDELVRIGRVRCVACTGAATCRLGLCLSRELANAIELELLPLQVRFGTRIRISGCPNSCGQHAIAPIGLYGTAARVNGKMVPYYAIVAGGQPGEGNAALAQLVGKVPARAVPSLLREFFSGAIASLGEAETLENWIDRIGLDYLRRLIPKYSHVPTYRKSPEFYRDFGSTHDFSPAGREDNKRTGPEEQPPHFQGN